MRGDASGRRARLWRGVALVSGLALLMAAACGDDDKATTVAGDNNSSRTQDSQDLRIEVGANSVSPAQVRVQTGTSYQVYVKNTGQQECVFYIGEYLKDLRVAAGAEQTVGVEVPGSPTANQSGGQAVKMGCAGDSAREGSANIINLTGTGSGAGGGAAPGGGVNPATATPSR